MRPDSSMARNCGVIVADMERERSWGIRSFRKAWPGSVLDDSDERRAATVPDMSTRVDEVGEEAPPTAGAEAMAVSSCRGYGRDEEGKLANSGLGTCEEAAESRERTLFGFERCLAQGNSLELSSVPASLGVRPSATKSIPSLPSSVSMLTPSIGSSGFDEGGGGGRPCCCCPIGLFM